MSAQAKIALQLMRVLDWTNPDGKIRDFYIPGWLLGQCDRAIDLVPLGELRKEYRANQEKYPPEMLKRWEETR